MLTRAQRRPAIDGICAHTPAAKGPIDQAHLTMQDRLVKEVRLEGIYTIEAANAFMPAYVETYPVRPDEDLDSLFAWQEQRKSLAS